MKLFILFALVALAVAAPKDAVVAPLEKVADAEPEAPAVVDDDAQEIAAEEAQSQQSSSCINNCKDRVDGDYGSCNSCNSYTSCSGGVFYGDRPCPANLEWDDGRKRCEWVSNTCGDIRRVARGCQRNGIEPDSEPLRISCEQGRVIFVRWAFYGRKRSSRKICGYSRPHDDRTDCSGDQKADRTIVRDLCNGRNSCEVIPTNAMFGNPCYNTYKYLQVRYSCVKTA